MLRFNILLSTMLMGFDISTQMGSVAHIFMGVVNSGNKNISITLFTAGSCFFDLQTISGRFTDRKSYFSVLSASPISDPIELSPISTYPVHSRYPGECTPSCTVTSKSLYPGAGVLLTSHILSVRASPSLKSSAPRSPRCRRFETETLWKSEKRGSLSYPGEPG